MFECHCFPRPVINSCTGSLWLYYMEIHLLQCINVKRCRMIFNFAQKFQFCCLIWVLVKGYRWVDTFWRLHIIAWISRCWRIRHCMRPSRAPVPQNWINLQLFAVDETKCSHDYGYDQTMCFIGQDNKEQVITTETVIKQVRQLSFVSIFRWKLGK